MKKIIVILITIIILLSLILTIIIYLNINKEKKVFEEVIKRTLTEPVFSYSDKELTKWYLTLVNRDNEIKEDYQFTLGTLSNGREFDQRAITYLEQMISDAKKAGVSTIWAQSTYRSYELQEYLYNNRINNYLNKGYSYEEAKVEVEKLTLPPGTSEHNIGLAVDFNTITLDFQNTEAFNWLQDNAHLYGFILRYPADKTEITNINYEPWHYRYVTKEHATKIKELGLCLEEYIDYLKRG